MNGEDEIQAAMRNTLQRMNGFDMAELYVSGHSAAHIGNLAGTSPETVLSRLRALGVQIRKPGKAPEFPKPAPAKISPPPKPEVKHCICRRKVFANSYGGVLHCRICRRPEH